MWGLIALLIYTVQWLGVVLGVGAEAVLLVGHLSALHARKPQWLANVPEVRTVQRWGLVLIVLSGAGAISYQLFNDITVLFIPTFGFKWVLIALASFAFWAERWMRRARGWLEGFAGATWLALFVVHSVAPIFVWEDFFFFYAIWVAVFLLLWGAAVWVMRRGAAPETARKPEVAVVPHAATSPLPPPAPTPAAHTVAPKPVVAAVSRPVASPPPPPAPKPIVVPPVPKPVAASVPNRVQPVAAPQPVSVAVIRKTQPEEVVIHEAQSLSLWQRFVALFARAPKREEHAPAPHPIAPVAHKAPVPAPQPSMASVSAPVGYEPAYLRPVVSKQAPPIAAAPKPVAASAAVPKPPPAVELLELMAPVAPRPAAAAPAEPLYVPDYNNAPGVMIMPQKPEDLANQNRAPIVQPA